MTAPEPIAHLHRAAIDGAQYLPLNLCKASGLNHRKRFNAATLAELAQSIEKVGVMQPVLARPIAGAKRGGALYEIVVGERRLRACEIVADKRRDRDTAFIPAIVRELTDFEAREFATVENLQREDVHPLEEAEGYEDLLLRPVAGGEFNPPRAQGYTVEQLAARIGKSTGYVFKRLKLLALIPAAREAFYEGKVTNSVAVLIARMPTSVQADATKRVLDGWGGEPLPLRHAAEMFEREFMLKLASAPFKITDESLVPAAGSCKACPKRTGASPDLFDDIKSADVCTDIACFAQKKDAHQARLIEQARAEGREVIMGADAKKVLPHRYGDLKGYLKVEDVQYGLAGSTPKPLEKLLGKDSPPVALLEDPHTHELVRVVRRDAAMQVLKDKGLVKGKDTTGTDAIKKAKAKAERERAWRTALAQRAVDAIARHEFDELDVHTWLLPEVAESMWEALGTEDHARVIEWIGLGEWKAGIAKDGITKALRAMTAAELDQFLLAMTAADMLYVGEKRLQGIAAYLGIDATKVRAELDAEAKAKAKKPAAKNAAPAKAKAGTTRAVKYRCAHTGETWSGRGLQPKWLKVALAGGKTLADFTVDAKATVAATKGEEPATAAKRPQVVLSDTAAWPFDMEATAK